MKIFTVKQQGCDIMVFSTFAKAHDYVMSEANRDRYELLVETETDKFRTANRDNARIVFNNDGWVNFYTPDDKYDAEYKITWYPVNQNI